ncbi:unnamed protein product [Penicillium salamii]|nr:unnamed protein product [Penicillium salamii]
MRPLLSIHVISFCRGFQKASDRQGMIETYCSRSFRDLVPLTIPSTLPNAQGNSLAPQDVFRSEYIINRLTALSPTRRLMSISYTTAIVTLGLSIFFRINKIQRGGSSLRLLTAPARIFSVYPRLPASHFDTTPSMMELFSIILSTLCVGAASFIASIISSEFVYLINNDGNPYGVSASHGDSLSNISWIATSIQSLLVIESLILVLKHKTGYLTCEVIDSSLHIHQP